ncbi:MAG: hypothetical protein ABSH53_02930 [Holophaga sp.]|jgi:hypothetical protein
MAIIYSKIDGKPQEVPEWMFNELVEFEANVRNQVLANNSSQPIEYHHTHMGMLRAGEFRDEEKARERAQTAADKAKAEKLRLEPPHMDPKPGQDWSDLVG